MGLPLTRECVVQDSVLQWLAEDRSLTAYAIAERIMLMNLASVDPAANVRRFELGGYSTGLNEEELG